MVRFVAAEDYILNKGYNSILGAKQTSSREQKEDRLID